MAIHFKKLSWKNFLSTGNAGTTILLDKSQTTLVQGASGSGKSTMIDALCFSLYGKPFRDINKPGLVNSVNGKNLEVEVEFETNSRLYRVVRGIKPNRFDIFCDGKLVTQDAAVRDYQKVLEQQILMMTFKTFTQIVILGSTAFTPFMQLSQGARREVIEDILDIGIFSTMNGLLKQHLQETKDQQQLVDTEIKTLKERAEGLKRLVDTLSEKKDERFKALKEELSSIDTSILDKSSILAVLLSESEKLTKNTSEIKDLIGKKNEVSESLYMIEYEETSHNQRKDFFSENDVCPTCKQEITGEHKHSMIESIDSSLVMIKERIAASRAERDGLVSRISELHEMVEALIEKNKEIKIVETKLDILNERKVEIAEEIIVLETESKDVDTPKKELKDVAKNVLNLVEKKKSLAEQRKMQESASLLLKDSGIKTSIIKEYLPLINRYLNKYLSDLQMDVEFTLDEQFNEVVKSRYRDEFVYGNFSEGEKLRIDVALMMVWRHIAKIKNSASCNLLIIDEVLSGRLDQSNQDIVIDMINNLALEGSNIFVIAHQDSLVDKFRSGIRFEKNGNFSVMV